MSRAKITLSRRDCIRWGLGTATSLAGYRIFAGAAQSRTDLDAVLLNGKFVDGRGVAGRSMTIRNGRIVSVGQTASPPSGSRVIDLGGRTVVPGFLDAHVHFTRAGINPGYEARRIERAFSIREFQETIAKRAQSVPEGEFITCIGGWNHTQFAEARRPTKAELDEAAPRHPVYISGTGAGTGAITNTPGRTFFASKGVAADENTGVVTSANNAVAALQAMQKPQDRLRGTADLNAHANSLGL